MIARQKRPLARTQYEKELRAGKRDGLHRPYLVGVRDWILHRHNHNPFRTNTSDYNEYERGFNAMLKEFTRAWNQANATDHNDSPHG